ADRRVRRRDERVRAEIDVEHRALRALEQHAAAVGVETAQDLGHVRDERLEALRVAEQAIELPLRIDLPVAEILGQRDIVQVEQRTKLFLDDGLPEKIGNIDL